MMKKMRKYVFIFLGLLVLMHVSSETEAQALNPDHQAENYYSLSRTEIFIYFRNQSGNYVKEYRSGFRFRFNLDDPKIRCKSLNNDCGYASRTLSMKEDGYRERIKFFVPPGTTEIRFYSHAGKSSKTLMVGRYKQPPTGDYRNLPNYGYQIPGVGPSLQADIFNAINVDQMARNNGGTIGGISSRFAEPLSESEAGWFYVLFRSDGWVVDTQVYLTVDEENFMEWFRSLTEQDWEEFESYGSITTDDSGGDDNSASGGDDSAYGGGDGDDGGGDTGQDTTGNNGGGDNGDNSAYGGGNDDDSTDNGSNQNSTNTGDCGLACQLLGGTCTASGCVYPGGGGSSNGGNNSNQNSGDNQQNGGTTDPTDNSAYGGGNDTGGDGSNDSGENDSNTDNNNGGDQTQSRVVDILTNDTLRTKVLTMEEVGDPRRKVLLRPKITLTSPLAAADFFAILSLGSQSHFMAVADILNPDNVGFIDYQLGDRIRPYKRGTLAGQTDWSCDIFLNTLYDFNVTASDFARENIHFIVGIAPRGEVQLGIYDNLRYIDISFSPEIAE